MNNYLESEIKLSIVVPVYNEEKNIKPFLEKLIPIVETTKLKYEVLFILDPSKDKTEEEIRKSIELNSNISLLIMSRRWGQNACLMAGMKESRGDACITIDVDLQDPPELIPEMYKEFENGNEVILTKRSSRKGEFFIRLLITKIGYWAINKLSDIQITSNVGDYRLISRRVINELILLKEGHGFFRGLIPFIGFKQKIISYDRDERATGNTKYSPFFSSIKHGIDGVVAFSIKPLTMMISAGLIIVFFSFLVAAIYLVRGLIFNQEMSYGLLPLLLLTIFFGGVQILCFGLIGQYIGRIYDEVRDRPKYIIEKKIISDNSNK